MKVYVILGRFGDVYMVCKNIPGDGVVFVSKAFSKIVLELFPHLKVFILDKNFTNIDEAMSLAKIRFPDAKIGCCQQNGLPNEIHKQFRNYQSYQEFQAREL
jgi:hypothetical protein